MNIRKAERKQAKIKMGLQGPSGSGKTLGALKIAFSLCNDWSKVVVIDSENHSADLYATQGDYSVLSLTPPYSPERYIEAINECIEAGMEVIILDSISHEWEGAGGVLDIHGNMAGNSFTNWSKITPRHNAFINSILLCPVHVISTIRTKQDYVLQEKNGKYVPEKMGLKGITRDGMDYELTIVLDIDIKHNTVASKDRTGLFVNEPEFRISNETGSKIKDWCNQGAEIPNASEIGDRILASKSIEELLQIYELYPQERQQFINKFKQRKAELQEDSINPPTNQINENGTDNY